ncbi:MAG: hypothetical protein AAFR21_04810 [Pseudomonadota bacterium]
MQFKRMAIAAATGLLSLGVVAGTSAPAFAQDDEENQPRRRSETLDPAVAKSLGEAYELITAEQYQQAQTIVNQLIAQRGDRMKPFDKSTTYEILGQIQVNLDNFRGALTSFRTALNAGGLPPERNNQLQYYIAQINFQLEDYDAAIRGLNDWIRSAQASGDKVDANAYYLLAAANVSRQPPNFRAALDPAERVLPLRPAEEPPKKGDYDLLNLIYSELSENTKRGNLLERMINIWPGERSYWTQLGGLYSTTGRDQEAFSVFEVAYRAGLLEKEGEIVTLVNFYSFFDNPYRGAKLLEKEFAAGRVQRTQANLVLLSQLWSQSREHKRAIPILREAAGGSSNGKLSYRLGQVLLADEQYGAATTALNQALRKGGLNSREQGDVYLLLGTARFSGAGADDCAARLRARGSFSSAQRYTNSSRQAADWVTYINAINDTEFSQRVLENQQNIEIAEAAADRLKTQIQVCRLQGGGNCEELEAQRQESLDEVAERSRPGRIVKCGATPPPDEEEEEVEPSDGSEEDASEDEGEE